MAATLAEGTIFASRYRVVRSIAAGAMGEVYEAVHVETNRRRALKVMHAHLFQSEEMRDRFKREARIAADVESEHIVDVSDAGIDAATGMPFLVMELLRGEELGQRLKRLGRLPPAEVLTYLRQTAMALDRTHAALIVHRDLKPANLFLTFREDGSPRIKILDFGVAKLVAENATGAAATQSLGTPLYMAPEQFMPEAKLTGAADIYALGMMAYTLLVGSPYWKREAAGGLMPFVVVAVRGPQEPPVQRAASWGVSLPPGFNAWFARATAMDPAARFRTATEAVQALEWALHGPDADLMARTPLPHMPARAAAPALPPAAPAPPLTAPGQPPAMGIDPLRASSPHFAPIPPAMPAPAHASSPHFAGMPLAVQTPVPAFTPPARAGAAPDGLAPPFFQQASASTSAIVSVVQPKPSRGAFIAAAALLGIAILGAGGWLLLRPPARSAPAASLEPTAAAPATSTAAAVPSPAEAAPPAPAPVAAASADEPATTPSAGEPAAAAPMAVAPSPTSSSVLPANSPPVAATGQPSTPGASTTTKSLSKPALMSKKSNLDSLLGQH